MHLPTDDTYSVPPLPETWTAPPGGRVLCFAPHPDDEAAGPGGVLGLHVDQGDPVRIVMATDGIAGDPDGKFDPASYVARRRSESRTGMAALGCTDFVFWGFPDSCEITDADVTAVSTKAAEEIDTYRPDTIYVPWEGEGNSDHRAVYCGVVRALRHLRIDGEPFAGAVLGYEIWNLMVPDVIVDITRIIDRKREALRAYDSQLAYADYVHPVLGMNAHRSLIINHGFGYGEAYRRVRFDPLPAASAASGPA